MYRIYLILGIALISAAFALAVVVFSIWAEGAGSDYLWLGFLAAAGIFIGGIFSIIRFLQEYFEPIEE